VAGIVEGKLRGGSSTRYRVGTARFQGRRWCFSYWSARKQRKFVRELWRGDVALMVLLVRKEKGWNFGSTRIRTVVESEITNVMF
jgi:hypothetical protein